MIPDLTIPEQGEVAELALPRIALGLWKQRFCGTLCLAYMNQKKEILFHQGSPVQIRSSLEGDSLILFLIRSAGLSEDDARMVRSRMRKKTDHEGIAIMELGLMDPPALFASIKQQLRQSLHESFGWKTGHYSLDAKSVTDPRLAPFRLDPLPLIQKSLQIHWDIECLFAELQKDFNRFPSTGVGMRSAWRRLRREDDFDPMLWTPERTLTENLGKTTLSPCNVSALWILKACGALSFTEESENEVASNATPSSLPLPQEEESARPPTSSAQDSPGPATTARDQVCAFQEEITSLLEASESGDYYTWLNVDRRCPTADVRKAYLRAAKRYHPDIVHKYGLDELKAQATKAFAQITVAFEVLSDSNKRQSYDAQLRGESTEAAPDQIAQAEIGYQKAEILLRMGQFREAIPYLRQAVDLVPDEEDFHATLGWALYKTSPSEPRRAQEALEKAIQLKPDHALAHFRLGIVYRALGDTRRAQKALEKAKGLERAKP